MTRNVRTMFLILMAASPSLALAKTDIQWWHAMQGVLGERVNEIATKFNATQQDYEVKPVFKGSYPETLNAAIAAFYYLRVVVYMYMREAPDDAKPLSASWPLRLGLIAAAVGTIIFGVVPGLILPTTQAAAQVLLIAP